MTESVTSHPGSTPPPSGRPVEGRPAEGRPTEGERKSAAYMPGPAAELPTTLVPEVGLHCGHFYYQFDRAALAMLSGRDRASGVATIVAALDPAGPHATERLQSFLVAGHKADFGMMLMDHDPLKIDAIHQTILGSALGPAIKPTYSFISLSEISEYVPTLEQYAHKLIKEGAEEGSPVFQAKLAAYEKRLPMMNAQRLAPKFPDWPAMCFYPMNKRRDPGANWFTEPFSLRDELMAEHGLSGRAFAGKVMQLISVGIGLDDWEWGVTLWAKNPQYLKEIVYTMRFDKGSARYAVFGPFYTGYVMPARQIFEHCGLAERTAAPSGG